MYANHHSCNALRAYLEERLLGWTTDIAKTIGKRFVEDISKAFFNCCPSTWQALNDRPSNGAFVPLRDEVKSNKVSVSLSCLLSTLNESLNISAF